MPLPKDHAHDVGAPVEVSVKVTNSGEVPDVARTVERHELWNGRLG